MKKETKLMIIIFAAGFVITTTYLIFTVLGKNKVIISPFSKDGSVLSLFVSGRKLTKLVYGYLPYWSLDKAKYLQFNLLTDVAYFGVQVDRRGNVVKYLDDGTLEPGYSHWHTDTALSKLVKDAKRQGVRVALTIVAHNEEELNALLKCEPCWPNLVENIKDELNTQKIKDINLNFEYSDYTDGEYADQYSKLVDYVNKELDKTYINSFVTVATFADSLVKPRVTNPQELAKGADLIFVMAYDFHQPTSENAGPVAPIGGKGVAAEYDITTMLDDYLKIAPADKILLGIPYYGYNWVVESPENYSKRVDGSDETGYSQSQTYSKILETTEELNLQINWDNIAKVPYFNYTSPETGSQRQVYFDNQESLKIKYELVNERNLGGVGIWALGYDDDRKELWDLLKKEFAP